jgi:hypothetical protein
MVCETQRVSMTDYGYDDDDDDQDVPALLKDLRKQLKLQSQKNKELEEKLAEQTTRTRSMTLAEVLKGAGVHEKVASLVPSSVEPTAEAVGEWLKEYGDVFGVGTQGTTSPTEGQEDQEVPPEAQTMSQMQNVAATGEIKGQTRQVTQADLNAASSEEEIWALIRKSAAQGS